MNSSTKRDTEPLSPQPEMSDRETVEEAVATNPLFNQLIQLVRESDSYAYEVIA